MLREDGLEVVVAEVGGDDLAEDIAEVGGVEQVALLVELIGREARPTRNNFLAGARSVATLTECITPVEFINFSCSDCNGLYNCLTSFQFFKYS